MRRQQLGPDFPHVANAKAGGPCPCFTDVPMHDGHCCLWPPADIDELPPCHLDEWAALVAYYLARRTPDSPTRTAASATQHNAWATRRTVNKPVVQNCRTQQVH